MNAGHLEPNDILYVVVSSERGSFREAARILNVCQSTVSRSVRTLEDRLGVSLFTRGPSGVSATVAGLRFIDECLPAVRQITRAARASTRPQGAVTATVVRVGIARATPQAFISSLERRISDSRMWDKIELVDACSTQEDADVRRGRLDAAIVAGSAVEAPLCSFEVWREPLHGVLEADHPLSECSSLAWADMDGERILAAPETIRMIQEKIPTAIQAEIANSRIEQHFTTPDALIGLAALRRGIAVIAGPDFIPVPGVVAIPLSGDDTTMKFYAAWSPGNVSPTLEKVLKIMQSLRGRGQRTTRSPGHVTASDEATPVST